MNRAFESLLEDWATVRGRSSTSSTVKPEVITSLGQLHPENVFRLLDGYSAATLQKMSGSRGFGTEGKVKKAEIVRKLATRFYEPEYIKKAVAGLSPVALDGLRRIKQVGGMLKLSTWQMQMQERYDQPRTQAAQAELIGNLLVLYGDLNSYGIDFNGLSKHELHASGSGGNQVVLWTYPQVLQQVSIENYDSLPTAPSPYNTHAEPKIKTSASFDNLLADIIAFLRYLEQNSVKILKSGEIGKRDFTRINDLMTIKESRNMAQITKIEEAGRLNFLWSLLRETGLATVVEEKQERYARVQPAQSDDFYALPRYQQARLLTTAWMVSNFNDFKRIPTLVFISGVPRDMTDVPDRTKLAVARTTIMITLQEYQQKGALPAERWLDLSRLVSLLRNLDPDILVPRRVASVGVSRYSTDYDYYSYDGYFGLPYYNGFTSTLKKPDNKEKNQGYYGQSRKNALKLSEDWKLVEGEWLAELFAEPLAWLGVAELGTDAEGRPAAFRLTDLGAALLANQPTQSESALRSQLDQLAKADPNLTRALLVQPNFDVMILAPLQNMPLLRQIDRFADQASLGDVAMYRITKDSALRGMRNGLLGSEIIELLENNSRVPVAQNVASTIADWASEFERLILYEETNVLETSSAEVLDRLLAIPEASKLMAKRLAPTFALIRGKLAQLEPFLQQAQGNTKRLPVYLDYKETQPGILSVEGYKLTLKTHTGNPYLYYRLGQFADLVDWQPAQMTVTFQLSAEAGQRAQQNDLTFDKVNQFLTRLLPMEGKARSGLRPLGQLPPSARLALRGWLGYYSQPVAHKAILIKVTQSQQLDDIFSLPEFEQALLERPTSTTALVREDQFETLRERLASLGMPITAPEFDPAPLQTLPPVLVEPAPEPAPTTGRGRKAKAPAKPKETAAEQDRRVREEQEQVYKGQSLAFVPIAGPNAVGRTQNEILETMQMLNLLARGKLPLGLLSDDDDDFDGGGGFPPPPPRRR